MILVRLTWFYDFMQVIYCARKPPTKNLCFPTSILFTIIYLLREQKLKYNNYCGQQTNVRNFVQAKQYDMIMYANIQYEDMHIFLYLISSRFRRLEFYIMDY
jgi:hypothetical protein